MSRSAMTAFLVAILAFESVSAQPAATSENPSCLGLPISHFESRFPTEVKRLTLQDDMLETLIEFWKTGSRPDFPKRPERVVIYVLPGLPLIIGYQERHCVIAYLAVDSVVFWRWLRHRLGWKV